MSLTINYNPQSCTLVRIVNHATLGLKKEIGDRTNTPANLIEKTGNGILRAVNMIPRTVKAVARAFQDPRIITIALTALALFATSLLFYPTATLAIKKVAFTFIAKALNHIPLWAVKFSAYLTSCFAIIGFGLRAGGRFNNTALMKEFYHLPQQLPYNPARLYAYEINRLAFKA